MTPLLCFLLGTLFGVIVAVFSEIVFIAIAAHLARRRAIRLVQRKAPYHGHVSPKPMPAERLESRRFTEHEIAKTFSVPARLIEPREPTE